MRQKSFQDASSFSLHVASNEFKIIISVKGTGDYRGPWMINIAQTLVKYLLNKLSMYYHTSYEDEATKYNFDLLTG